MYKTIWFAFKYTRRTFETGKESSKNCKLIKEPII